MSLPRMLHVLRASLRSRSSSSSGRSRTPYPAETVFSVAAAIFFFALRSIRPRCSSCSPGVRITSTSSPRRPRPTMLPAWSQSPTNVSIGTGGGGGAGLAADQVFPRR